MLSEETQARLLRLKLEAMKELAYGASHEINNPLANIAARAQTLLNGEADPERRRALQAIHKQALRAHEMISDLMLFARPPALAIEPIDVRALVKRIVSELSNDCRQNHISLKCNAPDSLAPVHADGVQLSVAVKAICENAIEAIGRDGEVQISLHQEQPSAPHGQVSHGSTVIEIADNGPGISDEVKEHLFDPFFSGREAGRGLGFGLSKSWRIISEHGGRLSVANRAGQGAVFSVTLPNGGPVDAADN